MDKQTQRRFLSVLLMMFLLGGVWNGGSEAQAPAQAPLRKITLVYASTVLGVGTAPLTSLPKALGYFQQEGLDVNFAGAAGSQPALQMVLSGNGDVATVQPITLFQLRPKGAHVKAFYTFVRHNWFYPVVIEGSPIKSLQDFKGKRIGVQSMGASMIPFMKLVLGDAGLDSERDVTFVGTGGGAGAAALLAQGKVDVLALWSAQYAAMENAGFTLHKFVDVSPIKDMSFAVSFVARDEWLRDNPKVAVGLGRSLARATLFAMTNPEATVRHHWAMFPQSKPTGVDDATAMRGALHELKDTLSFMRIDNATVKKWGMTTRDEIKEYAKVLQRAKLVEGDPGKLDDYFTADFIDAINAFDEKKVIEQARAYRVQ